MEFNRFGSTIPGSYWGCCACDIIQNFKVDPDAKASIELVSGDGGGSLGLYAGPTYRDIFWQRIRFGTFDKRDMPNHAFIAILTDGQLAGGVGVKWLAILKEAGFEFIRSVSNSVYQGESIGGAPSNGSLNHIFMLVRNIGAGAAKDQFTPPAAWTNLPKVVYEAWEDVQNSAEKSAEVRAKQTQLWNDQKALAKPLLTEAQAIAQSGEDSTFLMGLRIAYGKMQTRKQRTEERIAAGVDKQAQVSLRATQPSVA